MSNGPLAYTTITISVEQQSKKLFIIVISYVQNYSAYRFCRNTMKQHLKTIFAFTFILWLSPALVFAQINSCPEIVSKALSAADASCKKTGRNQACYGNFNLQATGQPGASNF